MSEMGDMYMNQGGDLNRETFVRCDRCKRVIPKGEGEYLTPVCQCTQEERDAYVKPRAWTAEEVRDMLIKKIRDITAYWATTNLPNLARTPEEDIRYRCDGVAFTILSTLDGGSLGLPGFDLIPMPHPDDKQYHKDHGENWFDPKTRISTTLHEFYHKRDPK